MKVILTVPCQTTGGPAGCLPLLPLLDRPFLQHAVEVLAGLRLTDVHFVLGRHADAVERHLGTGARWGGTFHYHLTPDPDRPAAVPLACKTLLRGEFPGVLESGREVRRGVRVGRGVSVSPSAVLVPPVFVGEGAVVRADAQVGPNAVVGAGCLIDAGAAVRDSV